jgi:O-antigen ligase
MGLLLVTTALVTGAGIAYSPWVTAGALGGLMLMLGTFARPLWIVGFMLMIGPVDLSFMTGGFKGLEAVPGGLDMNGIRLVGVTVALSSIVALDPGVLRELLGRYGRWFVVFLVWCAGTLIMSDSIIDGLRLLLKLAYPFLLFAALLGVARTRSELERLGDWVLAGAAFIAFVLNPLLIMGGAYDMTVDGRLRITAVAVHENPFSFYMLMMILISFVRFSTRRQARYLVLCAGLAGWMMATLTRITLLAGIIGFASIALFGILSRRDWKSAGYAVAAAALIAIPLAPVALTRTFGYVPGPGELLGMMTDPVYLYNTINWQGREIFWAVILSMFLASPIVGNGLGTTTRFLMTEYPPEWGSVVHNEYLRLLAEAGVIGFVLLVVALGYWALGAVRAAAHSADPLVREFATAAFAGLVAWAVIAITDNTFDYYASFTQYVGFMVAAALAASGLAGRVEGAGHAEGVDEPDASASPAAVDRGMPPQPAVS